MKKSVLCVWFSLLFTLSLSGQSVDPLTGQLRFSVPIHTLVVGNIEIPVSLNHDGTVAKVEAEESSAGVGWTLSTGGGSVSRIVRGLPDDFTSVGWLFNGHAANIQNFSPQGGDDLSSNAYTALANDYNFINGLTLSNYKDTEPDLFVFSAPGIDGQFIFDASGTPRFIGHSNLTITKTGGVSGPITAFVIKTPSGLTYTFDVIETISRSAQLHSGGFNNYVFGLYGGVAKQFNSAWLLNYITSAEGSSVVSYTYSNPDSHVSSDHIVEYKTSIDTVVTITDVVVSRDLVMINSVNEDITYTWADNLIQRISIIGSSAADSKQVDFIYQSVLSDSDQEDPIKYKHFLSELRQTKDCNSRFAYSFVYNKVPKNGIVQVPFKTNWEQDIWGNHNGVPDNQNIPSLVFYEARSHADRFRLQSVAGWANPVTLSGNDRTVKVDYYDFGALAQINLPTGGVSKITYEPNTYLDPATNEVFKGDGARVVTIISSGGDQLVGKNPSAHVAYRQLIKTYEYTLADGITTSGTITDAPAFGFVTQTEIVRTMKNMAENTTVFYSRVKELTPGQGYIVYEFSNPASYPAISYLDWTPTKTGVARKSGTAQAVGYLKTGYYSYPFAPNTNFDFERGLLTAVKEYSETNVLLKQRSLTYTRNTNSPINVYGLRYEKLGDYFVYGRYKIITGLENLISQEVVTQNSELEPGTYSTTTTTYTYTGAPWYLPSIASTTLPDGSVVLNKTKYAFQYGITSPTPGDVPADAIKKLNTAGRGSEIIEKITTHNGTVTGATITLYKDFNTVGQHVMPWQIKLLPPGQTLTESSATTSAFIYDNAKYVLANSVDLYDNFGRPVNVSDKNKNKIGFKYQGYQLEPMATATQATSGQFAFNNFEGSGQVPGWTGLYGHTISNVTLVSLGNIEKAESKYRVSCWAKGSAANSITFRVSGCGSCSVTLPYTTPSAWQYLEGELDVTGASSTFTGEVLSNSTIDIDDVVFLPKSASIVHNTRLLVTGLTSATDDRGQSVTYQYDSWRRVSHIFDQDRNLVQFNEYKDIRNAVVSSNQTPIAQFSASLTDIRVNDFVTFTPVSNCLPVSYLWTIEAPPSIGTQSFYGTIFDGSFSVVGAYTIKLKVTNLANGEYAEYAMNICILPPATDWIEITPDSQEMVQECDPQYRTYTPAEPFYCPDHGPISYTWSISTDNGASFSQIGTGPTITILVSQDFILRVNATFVCNASGNSQSICDYPSTEMTAYGDYEVDVSTYCN